MTTLYFAQGVDEDGDQNVVACATQQIAKDIAKEAYAKTQDPKQVVKVELTKDLGTRELLCALFNQETKLFTGSKEMIYVAGPRGSKDTAEIADLLDSKKSETEEPENPYGI